MYSFKYYTISVQLTILKNTETLTITINRNFRFSYINYKRIYCGVLHYFDNGLNFDKLDRCDSDGNYIFRVQSDIIENLMKNEKQKVYMADSGVRHGYVQDYILYKI